MKVDPYVQAVLLLYGAGKEINEENLKNVISAAGVEVDEARVKVLVEALKDVNIEEAIEKAAVAPVAAAPTQTAPAEEKKEEEEEKKEEKSEEEAAAGLASLFG